MILALASRMRWMVVGRPPQSESCTTTCLYAPALDIEAVLFEFGLEELDYTEKENVSADKPNRNA